MIGFISDTHGGLDSTLKALDVLSECELIIHLGDVLYHGPRNDLPADYNPRELAEVLKSKGNIIYVKGNCDSDVDEMVTEKDISQKSRVIEYDDKVILAIHGYEESQEDRIQMAREVGANIVVTGHTHVKQLVKVDGVTLLNPGSTTIPKDGCKSVAILNVYEISTIDIDSNQVIQTIIL